MNIFILTFALNIIYLFNGVKVDNCQNTQGFIRIFFFKS